METGKLQLVAKPGSQPAFVNETIGTQPHSFICVLSVTTFTPLIAELSRDGRYYLARKS